MGNINLTEIKELITKTERTKIYSMSAITDTYNTIFNKNEKQTSCGSCLRNLFIKIKNWYNKEIEIKNNEDVIVEEPIVEASPILMDNDNIEPLTLEVAREEVTIINEALEDGVIEPNSPEAELSNDRLVEVIKEKKKRKSK